MKVLVVGSGGREHALAWKLKQSPQVDAVFIAPGNPGTATVGTNVPIKVDQIDALADFAQKEGIGLTVVGPEIPLVLGIVDAFQARGLRCWGPSKAAAKLEGSKVEMKEFLRRHGIPTAQFKVFTRPAEAHAFIDELGGAMVVKADGLAAGKGVVVAKTPAEAHDAVDRIMVKQEFGAEAGRQVVIEDVIRGEEISVFAFCDGRNAVLLDLVQDHKQLKDGDEGPNTGGMGAFTPVPGLVKARDEDDIVRRILVPTMSGLVKEGRPFVGLLYMGLMIADAGPKVLEYNVRFGDPECQALMLRLKSDLVDICQASIDGRLDQVELAWDPRIAICVTMAAGDYPETPRTGVRIDGLESAAAQTATVFHAGTAIKGGELVVAGGRVLSVCALGQDLDQARAAAYEACDAIRFDGKQIRRDIGRRREARKGVKA
ncbi:MAG: Phosphoribosylamine--glycine ligase [Planctomycetota bacterium]